MLQDSLERSSGSNGSNNNHIDVLQIEMCKIKDKINENLSKYFIRQLKPLMIILGIFQFTFILLCILLLRTR